MYVAGSKETREFLKEELRETFSAAKAYAQKESDPRIRTRTVYFSEESTFPALVREIKKSHAVIIAASALALEQIDSFVRQLGELDQDNTVGLRGVWAGLIVHGVAHPFQTERYVNQILGSCNRAGMLLIPNGAALSNDVGTTQHVRLGHNAAVALSTHSEWNGMDAWSTEAA
jgi:hypothetical protein